MAKKSDFLHKYRGNLTSFKGRDNFIGIKLLCVFIIPFLMMLGKIYLILGIIIGLILLVYFVSKYDSEADLILFTEDEEVIRITKGNVLKYNYSELNQLTIYIYPKGNSHVQLKVNNKTLKFHYETNDLFVSKYSSIQELLFDKNPAILIFEKRPFEKHKYFMLRGEVRKVEID